MNTTTAMERFAYRVYPSGRVKHFEHRFAEKATEVAPLCPGPTTIRAADYFKDAFREGAAAVRSSSASGVPRERHLARSRATPSPEARNVTVPRRQRTRSNATLAPTNGNAVIANATSLVCMASAPLASCTFLGPYKEVYASRPSLDDVANATSSSVSRLTPTVSFVTPSVCLLRMPHLWNVDVGRWFCTAVLENATETSPSRAKTRRREDAIEYCEFRVGSDGLAEVIEKTTTTKRLLVDPLTTTTTTKRLFVDPLTTNAARRGDDDDIVEETTFLAPPARSSEPGDERGEPATGFAKLGLALGMLGCVFVLAASLVLSHDAADAMRQESARKRFIDGGPVSGR